MDLTRRYMLTVAGVSAATTVAGCVGSLEGSGNGADDGGDLPSYHRWLTTDDDGEVGYSYVDWSVFDTAGTGNQTTSNESGTWPEMDPMVGLPMTGAVAAAFLVDFGLRSYGLEEEVTYGQPDRETDDDEAGTSTVETMLSTNEAVVLTGVIDTDAVDAVLTAEPEAFSFAKQYEQTDEIGDYGVYTPSDEDGTDAIAVSDGGLVFPLKMAVADPVAAIRTPIDAAAGNAKRATDELDDFEWLVSTAGTGTVVVGGYGGEFGDTPGGRDGTDGNLTDGEHAGYSEFDAEYTELDEVESGVASLTLSENGAQASADFAAFLDAADASRLEASLGSSAAESSVEIEDGRLTASATWNSLEYRSE
jgi:hypothetical protein